MKNGQQVSRCPWEAPPSDLRKLVGRIESSFPFRILREGVTQSDCHLCMMLLILFTK